MEPRGSAPKKIDALPLKIMSRNFRIRNKSITFAQMNFTEMQFNDNIGIMQWTSTWAPYGSLFFTVFGLLFIIW